MAIWAIAVENGNVCGRIAMRPYSFLLTPLLLFGDQIMFWNPNRFATLSTSIAAASALVVVLPQSVRALTAPQVNDIARDITVLITGEDVEGNLVQGSGVIIAKEGKVYTVLTAGHVPNSIAGDIKLIAPRGTKAYEVDVESMVLFEESHGIDLGILKFESEEDYKVATLSPAATSEGQEVFVSGWPKPGQIAVEGKTGGTIRQFTDGRISAHTDGSYKGYSLVYNNVTRAGMSGGPVLDSGGRVVAIHGAGDREAGANRILESAGLSQDQANELASSLKLGFNYGIPVKRYLQASAAQGIFLDLEVDTKPAPDLEGDVAAASGSDTRDTLDDINSVLDTMDRVFDIIRFF